MSYFIYSKIAAGQIRTDAPDGILFRVKLLNHSDTAAAGDFDFTHIIDKNDYKCLFYYLFVYFLTNLLYCSKNIFNLIPLMMINDD